VRQESARTADLADCLELFLHPSWLLHRCTAPIPPYIPRQHVQLDEQPVSLNSLLFYYPLLESQPGYYCWTRHWQLCLFGPTYCSRRVCCPRPIGSLAIGDIGCTIFWASPAIPMPPYKHPLRRLEPTGRCVGTFRVALAYIKPSAISPSCHQDILQTSRPRRTLATWDLG